MTDKELIEKAYTAMVTAHNEIQNLSILRNPFAHELGMWVISDSADIKNLLNRMLMCADMEK